MPSFLAVLCSSSREKIISMMRFVWIVVIFLTGSEASTEKSLLMIGNSYIFTTFFGPPENKVYHILRAMLSEHYGKPVVSNRYTFDGRMFTDHLKDATSESSNNKSLRNWLVTDPKPWTWVVLQEQSLVGGLKNTPTNHYRSSLKAAIKLDQMIAATGGDTIFFQTWGRRNGEHKFFPKFFPDFLSMNAKLAEGYNDYVSSTSTNERRTKLAPVGMAFQYIYQDLVAQGLDPLHPGSDFYNLYIDDGSHPSLEGSYLAACVLFATMVERDPRELVFVPDGLHSNSGNTPARLRSVAYVTMLNHSTSFVASLRQNSPSNESNTLDAENATNSVPLPPGINLLSFAAAIIMILYYLRKGCRKKNCAKRKQ